MAFESLRELIANIEVGGGLQELQLLVALKASANALLEISRLPDATKVAPENIKSAKYKAQIALNAMDKAALDYAQNPGSPVSQLLEKRKGGFQVCDGCGTPGKCAEKKRCPAAARMKRAASLNEARGDDVSDCWPAEGTRGVLDEMRTGRKT